MFQVRPATQGSWYEWCVDTNPVQYLAHQLAHPSGVAGHVVAPLLNWRNGPLIKAAADLLSARPGEVVADVGFGGGLGLELLLEAVGSAGTVHGFDKSSTMVTRAARRWGAQVSAGNLRIHERSMSDMARDAELGLDALMTVNTAYYIDDLGGAFRSARTVLRPVGRIVVGVGDPHYMRRLPVSRYGLHLRSVGEVADALTMNGYKLSDHVRVGGPPTEDAFHLLFASADGS